MSARPIDIKKTAQGYVGATARKRCATCDHRTNNYGEDILSCAIGRFIVTNYGVCNEWNQGPKALNPVPERPKNGKGVDGAGIGSKASEAAFSGWVK